MGKADLNAVFLFLLCVVFFPEAGSLYDTEQVFFKSPEVFGSPFYSIPPVKFGIVKKSRYH